MPEDTGKKERKKERKKEIKKDPPMCKSDEICAGVSFIIGSNPHLHIAVFLFLTIHNILYKEKTLFLFVG